MRQQQSLPPLAPNAWLRFDRIQQLVDGWAPASVLEIGAGGGSVGARLAGARSYCALEPDDSSRNVAESRMPAGSRVIADLDEVAGELFDLVCAFEVLEHIEDDAGSLRSWIDHVAPGGRVLLSVPAHMSRFSTADEIVGHFRRYDPDALEDVLSDAGLAEVTIESYGFPLGHVLETARNALARRSDVSGGIQERSAASGRFHQPRTELAATLTRLGTAPFRLAQRPFRNGTRGVGLLAWGRLPRS